MKKRAQGYAPDVLAMLFTASGVLHFVAPHPFTTIVPKWLPHPDLWVYGSGLAELVCALGLVRRKRWSGYASTALLLAVFPANIQMAVDYQNDADRGALAQGAVWLRLPLQLPMIWVAAKVAKKRPCATISS